MTQPKVRKLRSDSITSQIRAAQAGPGALPFAWPAGISLPDDPADAAAAQTAFDEMQRGRSPEHWKPHHQRLLAETALMKLEIARLIARLLAEGSTTINMSGNLVRSATLDSLSSLNALATMNFKALGLTGVDANKDNGGKAAASSLPALPDGAVDWVAIAKASKGAA